MGKTKGAIAVASEKTGKSQQTVRSFINDHPELGIEKNKSNRFVITDEQMTALCDAIKAHDDEKASMRAAQSKRMTKEDSEKWAEAYDYFRYNIMHYDKKQSLPSSVVLRLKGMLRGKHMANNSTKDMGDYSFDVLLNTLKYANVSIQRAFMTKSFEDDRHKMAYALKVAENNLNTVYGKMKEREQTEKKIETTDISIITHESAEYITNSKKVSSRLKDLW